MSAKKVEQHPFFFFSLHSKASEMEQFYSFPTQLDWIIVQMLLCHKPKFRSLQEYFRCLYRSVIFIEGVTAYSTCTDL